MDQGSGDGQIHWKNQNPRDQIPGKNFPNFELLDAKIASAMNKIITNSHFKKKVSLEEQKAQKKRTGFCGDDRLPS